MTIGDRFPNLTQRLMNRPAGESSEPKRWQDLPVDDQSTLGDHLDTIPHGVVIQTPTHLVHRELPEVEIKPDQGILGIVNRDPNRPHVVMPLEAYEKVGAPQIKLEPIAVDHTGRGVQELRGLLAQLED